MFPNTFAYLLVKVMNNYMIKIKQILRIDKTKVNHERFINLLLGETF
jgi:hypothetical protein